MTTWANLHFKIGANREISESPMIAFNMETNEFSYISSITNSINGLTPVLMLGEHNIYEYGTLFLYIQDMSLLNGIYEEAGVFKGKINENTGNFEGETFKIIDFCLTSEIPQKYNIKIKEPVSIDQYVLIF